MDCCNLGQRKKRNVWVLLVTLVTSLCIGYYLARYENVCVPSATRLLVESHQPHTDPPGVIKALDHGCYLQASNFTQHQHSQQLLSKRGCTRKSPNVLIVGGALCGTATLKSALSFHPYVVVPEFVVPFEGNENYLDMMPFSLPHQITVDENQELMYMRNASNLLQVLSRDTKIIVLVRDPVARAMTEYMVLTSNASKIFYLKSLSKPVDLPSAAEETHVRVKRSLNKRHKNDKERKKNRRKAKHKDQRSAHRGKRGATEKKYDGSLHKIKQSLMNYRLEDTFAKSVLKTSSDVDDMHFLMQRSIYASGIKKIANVFFKTNVLVLDAEAFARSPITIMKKVETFLDLDSFFEEDFFEFDLSRGSFCFSSQVPSCIEPIPKQRPTPPLSTETVAILRQFFIPAMKVQNRFSGAYFPHLGENPLIFTPFR